MLIIKIIVHYSQQEVKGAELLLYAMGEMLSCLRLDPSCNLNSSVDNRYYISSSPPKENMTS